MRRRRHCSNVDDNGRLQGMCVCGEKQYEHDVPPDDHCYKCDCKHFKKMARISEAQKWVAYWMKNGYKLWRIVDYVSVRNFPNEYRISIATFRSMYKNGWLESVYEDDEIFRFELTERAEKLWSRGDLVPSSRNNQ